MVLALDGVKVSTLEEFYRKVWARARPDDEVQLTVLQGAEVKTMTLRGVDAFAGMTNDLPARECHDGTMIPALVKRFLLAVVLVLLGAAAHAAPSGLNGRLIVGYQGWFGCPGDDQDNKQWHHWFEGQAQPRALTVDILPALGAFSPADLCDTGLKRGDGSAVYVFSSQNPNIVRKHFDWLKTYGIDGVAFQRFVSHTRLPDLRKRSDNVLNHVRRNAERSGRVFYVTYDISGADPATVAADIRSDWQYLTDSLKLMRSAAYLRHGGQPVLQLWGFGFKDRPGTAAEAGQLIADLKAGRAGLSKATLVGGVPAGWRTLTSDSQTAPEWARVYRSFDFISPWSVGRYADEAGADNFRRLYLEPDVAETRRLGIGYMPVVFPGFSWRNLMDKRGQADKAILNQIPRRCGRFMWRQVVNVLESRADSVYAAMFDEVDEGTALFPLESREGRGPAGVPMLSLRQDGCVLPDDWYLRVTQQAAKAVRGQVIPDKSLRLP